MTAGLRLALNVFAWFLAMPVLFVSAAALESHRILSISNHMAPMTAVVLSLWAGVIYWRCVPGTPGMWRRAGYLAAFLGVMFLLGWAAMWLTFVVMLAIYGA
ncbi:hypothetical protein [Variovorax paradoxus]|uniref:hypothetical protein n=1 Tax=Variovorax paradoxus TaxID=34073 RepID=UPI002781A519|nr:hypothetical protein [Variovorax paradoxus]MDQ0589843.1 putative membrane protein YGL010W [Variovorax paradoxus]